MNVAISKSLDAEKQSFSAALELLKQKDYSMAAMQFHDLALANPAEKRYRVYKHYATGRLYLSEGDLRAARLEFKRAMRLDSGFEKARLAMKETPRTGLFTRMFGR